MGWLIQLVMLLVTVGSAIYQISQSKKKITSPTANQAVSEARKGFEIPVEGRPDYLPKVYGRAKIGGVRVYHNTSGGYIHVANNSDRVFETGSSRPSGDYTYTTRKDSGELVVINKTYQAAETGRLNTTIKNGYKNEFLFFQQALCQGPINDIIEVIVDESKYLNDPSLGDYMVRNEIQTIDNDNTTTTTTQWHKTHAAMRINGYLSGGVADTIMTANFPDRALSTFTGISYISAIVRLDREDPQFSGVPTLQFLIEGTKVRTVSIISGIYTLSSERLYYDVVTGDSAGTNPAWCLLDYLLDTVSGKGVLASELDLKSFYDAAQVCATIVDTSIVVGGKFYQPTDGLRNSKTKTLPLYECNLITDPKKSIRDNIESILETMGDARLVWSGGKYKLSLQYPLVGTDLNNYTNLDISKTITDDDLVLEQTISVNWPTASQRLNFCTVRFHNEFEDFKEDSVSWPSKTVKNYSIGIGGRLYPPALTGYDAETVGGIFLNTYGVWTASPYIFRYKVKVPAGVTSYTLNIAADKNLSLVIKNDAETTTVGTYSTSSAVTIATTTVSLGTLSVETVYTFIITANGGATSKGAAAKLSTSSQVIWTTKSIAFDSYDAVTSSSAIYDGYLAEDSQLKLETDIFCEGLTDRYHALAKAEELVRVSRTAFSINFKYIIRDTYLEPGDYIKVQSDTLSVGSVGVPVYFKIESVKITEENACDVVATRFLLEQLAWATKGNAYIPPSDIFDNTINGPSRVWYTAAVLGVSDSSGKVEWTPVADASEYVVFMHLDTDPIDNDNFPIFREIGRVTVPLKRSINVNSGSFVIGTTYEIGVIGSLNFTTIGSTANTVGTLFVATGVGTGTGVASTLLEPASALVNIENLVIGQAYKITTTGTFTAVGAKADTVNTVFIATGVGTGTGVASTVIVETTVIVDTGNFVIGNTYKISTVGNTNFMLLGAKDNTVGTEFVAVSKGISTETGQATFIFEPKSTESTRYILPYITGTSAFFGVKAIVGTRLSKMTATSNTNAGLLNHYSLTILGLTLTAAVNTISWSAYSVIINNTIQKGPFAAGSAIRISGPLYLYLDPADYLIKSTTNLALANSGKLIAIYNGGSETGKIISTLLPPTNLYVSGTTGGTYSSPDVELTWAYDPSNDNKIDSLRSYRIDITTTAGVIKRQEIVIPDNNKGGYFKITKADNLLYFGGSLGTRAYIVKVYSIDYSGGASINFASLTVSNPKPSAQSFNTSGAFGQIFLEINPTADRDILGYYIWENTSAGLSKTYANKTKTITGVNTTFEVANTTPKYYAIAAYDSFEPLDFDIVENAAGASALSINFDVYTYTGLIFTPSSNTGPVSGDKVRWSQFKVFKGDVLENTVAASTTLTEGVWAAGTTLYLYYDNTTVLKASSSITTAVGGRILATYRGGTDLTHDFGKAFISGDQLLAGTVAANALVAGQLLITGPSNFGDNLQSSGFKVGNSGDATGEGWHLTSGGNAIFNSIDIKKADGSTVLSSNTGMEWKHIAAGGGRPQDNATVGATFLQTFTFDVNPVSNNLVNRVISSDFVALPAALTYNSNALTQVSANAADYNNLVYSKVSNTVNASTCSGSIFTTPAHEYATEQRVIYSYTSSAIPGLANNTDYYVIKLSNTTFQLASSLGNATNNVPLSFTAAMKSTAAIISPSSLVIASDVFSSATVNNYLAGLPLRYTGTLPGLTAGFTYYAIPVTTTTFKVATSYSDALLATTVIAPTALNINGEFTCASNTVVSGTRVLYTTTAGSIPGLNLTTDYYYVRLSSTSFKLATTVSLAVGASPSYFVADVIPSSINTTTHIITVNSNPFPNSMEVKLTTAIGGKVVNTLYYVVKSTGTTLGLVTTLERVRDSDLNAGLTLTALAASKEGTTFTTSGAVPVTGTEVKYITTSTALGGFTKNAFYFVTKLSATTFKLTLLKGTTAYLNVTGTATSIMKTSSSFVAPLETLTASIPATSKIYYPMVTVSGTTNVTAATFTTTFAVSLDSVVGLNTVNFTPVITDAKFVPNTSAGKTVSFRVLNAASQLVAGINNKDTIPSYGSMFAAFEVKGTSYNILIAGVRKLSVDAVGEVSANTVFTIIYTQSTGRLDFFVNDSAVYSAKLASTTPMGFVAAFKTLGSSLDNIVHGPAINKALKADNNIQGRLTGSNASTFIADAAIGSAMIGSIELIGKGNFSVKSSDSYGERMEINGEVIKIFDATSTSNTTGLRVKLGNLDAV